ncbi:MAG: pyridoxal phosphate-dependent aminotransferase [Paracoccaceae bacterium]|nr:pyridoxal phosphate-dependent aminotransferase [Paracoccaceae bacterium]
MPSAKYTDLVEKLPASVPFVGPEAQERTRGGEFAARLGANENVFGPSPKAIKAMADAASSVWMYGDPESHDLRHALAQHHEIPTENIMIGEGIDALLGYLVRMFISQGDKVVTSAGAYPTFNYHVDGFGGDLVKIPYHNDHEDLPALLAKAKEVGAKLVYFANPDNPMGTTSKGTDIEAALDDIPDGCLLILDEAYIEFAPTDACPNIPIEQENVIRMRTFSKAYGMAGARVGYAMAAADLITGFNKIRNHFGMCRISQAGALAALADTDYLNETIENINQSRTRIAEIAKNHGLNSLPSATNFVAIDCGEDGDFARAVLTEVVAAGVFVRMPFVAPQDRCIRISCGRPQDLDIFEKAFGPALALARSKRA